MALRPVSPVQSFERLRLVLSDSRESAKSRRSCLVVWTTRPHTLLGQRQLEFDRGQLLNHSGMSSAPKNATGFVGVSQPTGYSKIGNSNNCQR
jgi:hypothetical protein